MNQLCKFEYFGEAPTIRDNKGHMSEVLREGRRTIGTKGNTRKSLAQTEINRQLAELEQQKELLLAKLRFEQEEMRKEEQFNKKDPILSTSSNKLPRFKEKLEKLKEESEDYVEQVLYLVAEIRLKRGEFTDSSLLSAFSQCLPNNVRREINPSANLSLSELLQAVVKQYNNPAKLNKDKRSLRGPSCDSSRSRTDQVFT